MTDQLPIDYTNVGRDRVLLLLTHPATSGIEEPYRTGTLTVNVFPPKGFPSPLTFHAEKVVQEACLAIRTELELYIRALPATSSGLTSRVKVDLYMRTLLPYVRSRLLLTRPVGVPFTVRGWVELVEDALRQYIERTGRPWELSVLHF